jgi:hypothetical protein
MIKIYAKKGATNYKEKRLIAELEVAVAQADESSLEGFPAKSFDELKALHDKYCGNFDNYEEVAETEEEKKHKEFRKGMEETAEQKKETMSAKTESKPFIDPFNDAEPIVRDYVLNDGFATEETEQNKTSFAEPQSFEESFELPSSEDEKTSPKANKEKNEKKPDSPINPKFAEMSDSKKKRSTKKLAKMIIDASCLLAEKGCIWWTTKDITEDKLVQYELEDTMDLQILLTLEMGQQITVREWFRAKVVEADSLFKVSKEDKEDLVESLYEVLLEKGVAPTPTQELMINAVKTFVLDMGLKAYALQQQIKSVLNQLVVMHKQTSSSPSDDVDFDDLGDNSTLNSAVDETQEILNPEVEISETEVQ